MKSRDLRLAQTIRGLDFKRDGKAVVADMTVCLTGYHVIKYLLMTRNMITMKRTTTVSPCCVTLKCCLTMPKHKPNWVDLLMLNGTLPSALRRRAGITGGTEKLPTTVDSYLQQVFLSEYH